MLKQISIDLIKYPQRSMKQSDVDSSYRQSVAALGRVVEPSVCKKNGVGGYTLMSSPAPWFTAQLLQISYIPVFVLSDDYANYTPYCSRSNLNPIEIAELNEKMMASQNLSMAALAEILGVNASTVSHTQRLLKLDETIQQEIRDGKVTESFARRFASFKSADQKRLFHHLTQVDQPKNIRDLESKLGQARAGVSSGNRDNSPVRKDPNTVKLEKTLSEHLGSNVRLKNGSMVIDYLDDNDILQGILERMNLPTD